MDHSELETLKADLRRMQARVDELEHGGGEPVDRRHMLRGLGVAALGAAAGGLAFTRPAAAADGANVVIGNNTQTADSPTWLIPTTGYDRGTAGAAFTVSNDATALTGSTASYSCLAAYADADADDPNFSVGLYARATTATPGETTAVGAKLDAPVPLKLLDSTGAGAPTGEHGTVGQFGVDNDDLWYCTRSYVSPTAPALWRKLASAESAGQYHPVTPTRVADTRPEKGGPGGITGGHVREVSVANAISTSNGVETVHDFVPEGVTAIMANVTVTSTKGAGYLTVNPGGAHTATASTINWNGANLTIANGVSLTLDADRKVTLIVNGAGAGAQVIIDVLGYYR